MTKLRILVVLVFVGANAASGVAGSNDLSVLSKMEAQAELTAARAEVARVHAAMGGSAALAKVGSLRISSNQKRWASNGEPRARPQTLVISMLLPHHILFEQQGDPRRGWAVDTPIASAGEPAASKERLKEDFAYVALRLLLRTDTPFPLTLRSFVNGSLQYDAPNGVKVFLDVDPQTHLPSRLHYSETGRTNAGESIPGATVAHRWDLEDYRGVYNVRLAHRWTYFRNGMRLIVDQAEKLELNPPLTPKDFSR